MNAKTRSKSHYEANKEVYKERSRRQRLEITKWYQNLKCKPCADCGKEYPPYVMQFDHVRGEKLSDLCSLVRKCNKKKVLEEIEKCEVVCANCHCERTYIRGISSVR